MALANRHFIKGQIWHLTHRCHKRQWLLKFKQDRDRWLFWLYQARQRYGLVVLNFLITSNHIHLLVEDQGKREISKSIQLLASRTAQEFNNRKNRVGAFWQDRYHATAIGSNQHLARCLRYIDLNMVRAGVVAHPSQWTHSGYVETILPVQRYRRLDLIRLCQLLGCSDLNTLQQLRFKWVEEALCHGILQREAIWSDSVAVGNEPLLEQVFMELKTRHPRARIHAEDNQLCLRESTGPYNQFLRRKIALNPYNNP